MKAQDLTAQAQFLEPYFAVIGDPLPRIIRLWIYLHRLTRVVNLTPDQAGQPPFRTVWLSEPYKQGQYFECMVILSHFRGILINLSGDEIGRYFESA